MPRRSKFSGSIAGPYSPRLNPSSKAPASVVGSAERALKSAGSDRKNVIKRAISSSSSNKSPFGQGKSGRKVRSGAIKAGLSGSKAASKKSKTRGISYLSGPYKGAHPGLGEGPVLSKSFSKAAPKTHTGRYGKKIGR